ncbi:galactokinase [Sphingobacterium alkalisoli]|uniref:Galactokinase n=1 Tax=Sphingobacterium alkalisoli TaxID=1874115 RepID=A0A4U0H8N5_9SPHI|nr:galactokinase [Sphingobacterium alkalisoli]TJY68181.1 galactokinase [Sphingobacterium alkalisoli]GGH08473.1 galactokinase [Sphingobacterium alkalisoli]
MIETSVLKNRYKEIFGSEPDLLAKSPGRINIIGEHTDYNEGFVLPTAIDKAIYVAVGKREDQEIHLYAEDFNEKYSIDLADLAITDKGWPNYILGVVDQLQKLDLPLSGFNLYLDGDVPLGAGLSSSAAVECATGFTLNELFSFGLKRVDIAKIGQLAEHTYAGVKCGIMDQFASVLSKEGHVLRLDCRTLEYEYVPLELGAYEIVLLNTNVKHSLASSAYNKRRELCEQGVAWVKEKHSDVNSLRDITVDMLDELVKDRDMDTYTKCKYVVEENIRLDKACEALKKGDIEELGKQLFLAHAALSDEYEVSCEELDFLVDFVKDIPEVVGARMMGGGFGGCTINIVKKGFGQQLADAIAPAYKTKFNLELDPIFVKADGGSQLLK